MGRSTELRQVKRSLGKELLYRANWLFFGTLVCGLLAMIPILGWFAAAGLFLLVLWRTFGPRELLIEGDCPACTNWMPIDPKRAGVVPCKVCGSVIQIGDGRLTLVDIQRQ